MEDGGTLDEEVKAVLMAAAGSESGAAEGSAGTAFVRSKIVDKVKGGTLQEAARARLAARSKGKL